MDIVSIVQQTKSSPVCGQKSALSIVPNEIFIPIQFISCKKMRYITLVHSVYEMGCAYHVSVSFDSLIVGWILENPV